MSDTPRTDVLLIAHDMAPPHLCIISHARELERELNAANESFRKLNIHALDLAARIKRLEEFASRFLNPDDLGWAIGKFDRDEAREALGKERVESKAKEDKP